MAKQPWISQIRNARSPAEQIDALRALKNEIIGHPLKKELAVELGILDSVVRLTYNKTGSRHDGKASQHSIAPRPLGEEEMVRLQGLQVIASLALGETIYLHLARRLLSNILLMICRRTAIPSTSPFVDSLTSDPFKPLSVE
jgi:hypothetical protein